MKIFSRVIIALLFLASAVSHAFHSTVSSTTMQSVDGQDFSFTLPTPNAQAGSLSFMTIAMQADLASTSTADAVSVFIEGIDYGSYSRESANVYSVAAVNDNAYTMNFDVLLMPNTTTQFLADGVLNVDVSLGDAAYVSQGWSSWGRAPFTSVDFTYNRMNTAVVPIPAGLVLYASALLGFVIIRRRKA
jgi:hypothetical protein